MDNGMFSEENDFSWGRNEETFHTVAFLLTFSWQIEVTSKKKGGDNRDYEKRGAVYLAQSVQYGMRSYDYLHNSRQTSGFYETKFIYPSKMK